MITLSDPFNKNVEYSRFILKVLRAYKNIDLLKIEFKSRAYKIVIFIGFFVYFGDLIITTT